MLRVLRPGHRPDLSCPAAPPPGSGSSLGLGHCSASSAKPLGRGSRALSARNCPPPLWCQPACQIRRRSAHMLCCSFSLQAARGLDNCGLSASSESNSRAFGGGCGGTSGCCPSRRRPATEASPGCGRSSGEHGAGHRRAARPRPGVRISSSSS